MSIELAILELTTRRREIWIDDSSESPTEWALQNVWYDEDEYRGPFRIEGAEYLREPLDEFADTSITDSVECWGSQTFKTSMLFAGICWRVRKKPCGIFVVYPTQPLGRRISKKRLQKCLKKTVPDLIPRHADRHLFTAMEMVVGRAGIQIAGGGSASGLSSTPASLVLIDETDKLLENVKDEADAVDLADQRTKNALWPQRRKTSTPSLETGFIWQALLKSDRRRYFIPCQGCSKPVVLAWSKMFTVFPIAGNEAFMTWDREAKRPDGTWDLDRVHRSARYQCPHCGFHIRDGHRRAAMKDGKWTPTAIGLPRMRGRHLPSLYSAAQECTAGRLALKFLEKKNGLLGLQGFINGDLAEPYAAQETRGERIELITPRTVEVTAEWKKIETVDCQAKTPHFWHVIRMWNGGNSEGIEFGPLDTWEDIRSRQKAHNIPDVGVIVDSGFGARSDSDVYLNCSRFGEQSPLPDGKIQILGWMPAKGMPGHKRWKNKDGLLVPFYLSAVDPYGGTTQAGQVRLDLFEFSSDFFKDILQNLRAQKGGYTWKVCNEMATDEYWTHMDGEVKSPIFNKLTGRTVHRWQRRSKHWPNHGNDCETMQVAGANFFGLFELK